MKQCSSHRFWVVIMGTTITGMGIGTITDMRMGMGTVVRAWLPCCAL